MGQGAPPSAPQMVQASWASLFTDPSKPYGCHVADLLLKGDSNKGATDHETVPSAL